MVEQGLGRLEAVLQKFGEHGLTLKPSKCEFFKTKIEYLGHEISEDGDRPGNRKIDVCCMPASKNMKQVRQSLPIRANRLRTTNAIITCMSLKQWQLCTHSDILECTS